MMVWNNKFIINKDHIMHKNLRTKFKITKDLHDSLRKRSYENNIDALNNDIKKYLIEKGILDYKNTKSAYNPFIAKNSYFNKMRLLVKLTNKCNLFCEHCFVESSTTNTNETIPFEQLVQVISEAISLGIYRIDFTGGEIYTTNYINELIKYLDDKPIAFTFFTNLTMLREDDILSLASSNGLIKIVTSVDYFSQAKHDNFRGRAGAFDATLKHINKLHSMGVTVCVNTMIMDDNHLDIQKIYEYFSQKSISVNFDTIINVGRARKNNMTSDAVNYRNIDFLKTFIKEKTNNSIDEITCGVGKNLLFLDENSKFQICPGLTDKDSNKYFLGNSILEASKKLSTIELICNRSTCQNYDKCSYGCRMRALQHSGNDTAPDHMLCYFKSNFNYA